MFYEVNLQYEREGELKDDPDNEGELTTQCFNTNKEIFKVAKAAFNMNLLTSVFLFGIVPNRVLARLSLSPQMCRDSLQEI